MVTDRVSSEDAASAQRGMTSAPGARGDSLEFWFTQLFHDRYLGAVQLAGLMGADDPEDVAQEAFARLHERAASLRDPSSALGYIRATVCNLARSRHRHLRVAWRRLPDLVPWEMPALPEEAAEGADHSRAIVGLLATLPRRQREVLVLRYWADLSEREIAETLGISRGSVKAHASRGLRSLETKVDADDF